MNNFKKTLLALAATAVSFGSFAMPKTTIEHVYYATSAKQKVVGYYYQGCVNGSHVEWGTRTYYRSSNDPAGTHDCSSMGEIGAEFRGQCVLTGLFREAYGNAIDGDGNIVYLREYEAVSMSCHHNQYDFPG